MVKARIHSIFYHHEVHVADDEAHGFHPLATPEDLDRLAHWTNFYDQRAAALALVAS